MKKLLLLLFCIVSFNLSYGQDIFAAARANDVVALEGFLKSGADVNGKNEKGYTPLILAVYNENNEATEFMLKNGANPNMQDGSGNTALMGATFKGYHTAVKTLLRYKANVNQVNYNDATALVFAATFGQVEIAKTLLSHGADKGLKDSRGKTAYDHALMQENTALINLLMK